MMTTQELLELAGLDALGMLDDEERAAFEAAFSAAAPAVQAQVRREQARIARNERMLPSVEAPPGLKARVLSAVRDAMAAVSGKGRAVAAKIGPTGIEPGLTIARPRGVNAAWRVAAVGALAASIALGVVFLNMRTQFQELDDAFRANQLADVLAKKFDTRFDSMLLDSQTQMVRFGPASPDVRARAMLLVDPLSKTGELYGQDLPAKNASYRLVLLDSTGRETRVLAEFKAAGTRFHEKISNLLLDKGQNVAIQDTSGGTQAVLVGQAS